MVILNGSTSICFTCGQVLIRKEHREKRRDSDAQPTHHRRAQIFFWHVALEKGKKDMKPKVNMPCNWRNWCGPVSCL